MSSLNAKSRNNGKRRGRNEKNPRRINRHYHKIKFQKIAVVVVLSQVFLYTWVHLILSYIVGVEIAPTVSCAFYAFCGAEAGLLAMLKKSERKEDEENEGNSDAEVG